MILPMQSADKRRLADFSTNPAEPLVVSTAWASVTGVESDSLQGLSSTHLDHTPSPQGRWRTAQCPLPRFFGICCRGGMAITSAPGAEPCCRSRVGSASKSRQGTSTCPSRNSSWRFAPARALRPVATRWANRPLAVPPSARALRPSPAAASRRVLPSGRQAISPTASSTPAVVTDTCALGRTRSIENPARRTPSRGFCMQSKTQKDSRCSRKS